MSVKSDLVGSEGMYAAAAELAHLGWLVSPTLGGATRTDLLIQHTGEPISAAVQVKARSNGDFHVDITDPSPPSANEWVVLVSLTERHTADGFCVVPRNHVVCIVRVLQGIFSTQGKKWPRKLLGEKEFRRYRGRWDLMTSSPEQAPWLLSPWVFEALPEHPQPDLAPPEAPALEPA